MIKTFHCPNCHASLEHNTNEQTVTCPYCNTTVIVPEDLRAKSADRGSSFDMYSDNSMAVLLEVTKLARSGQIDDAVWLYQEAFDASEMEARRVVAQMQGGQVVQIGTQIDYGGVATTAGRSCGGVIVSVIILFVVLGVAGFLFLTTTAQSTAEYLPEVITEIVSSSGETGAVPDDVMQTVEAIAPEVEGLLSTPESTFAGIVMSFGEEGIGPGRFNDTRFIGSDAQGFIYAGDWEDGRIQVFDSEGTFVTTWNAEVETIQEMAVSRQGVVYIVRARNLYAYEGQTGELLYQLALEDNVSAIYANIDGGFSIYYGSIIEDHYVRYDAQGNETERFTRIISEYDDDFVPHVDKIALDGAGNIYFMTREAILKFGSEGNFINRFGSDGNAEDQFRSPNGFAIDGRGRVYVADFNSFKVFDSDGRFVASFPYPQPGAVFFNIVVTDDDKLIGMDRNGNQVVIYEIKE